MFKYILLSIILIPKIIISQDVEVEGKVIIHVTETDTVEETIIVKQPDGTLAERELGTIIGKRIGDFYEGGIVFFTYNNGKNGLIASVENLANSLPWAPNVTDLPNTESNFDGQINTNEIIAFHGNSTNYAALECSTYSKDGYNDWYLPSHGELRLIMEVFHKLNLILETDQDPTTILLSENSMYWSSTQYNSSTNRAWVSNWNWVMNLQRDKTETNHEVRAIRKF